MNKMIIPNQMYALLQEQGVDLNAQPLVLMRHKDKRYPLYKYLGTKPLTLYQSMQKIEEKPNSIIVAFYGHKPGHGILLGVWRVISVMAARDAFNRGLLEGSFEELNQEPGGFYHELEEIKLLSDMRLKLEIRWGKEVAWRRILKPIDNYEVWMRSESLIPFQDLKNTTLVMAQLRIALQDVGWQQGLGNAEGA